jgi:hypothetical protein
MIRETQKLCALISFCFLLAGMSLAQQPGRQGLAPATAGNPVAGSGQAGRISKWIGVDGSNTFTIGNANIFEDKFGKIGIGTIAPTSLLTVQGMIETTLGGYKFPDGTIQTTAGIPFVIHDASLIGDGRSASPLGIAPGGVQTVHIASNAVTAPKIANGTVVRSLNGLFDQVLLAGGANITITPVGNTLTIASPNSLTSVAHDSTLTGAGTIASPLGVADGGIANLQLANNAVTLSKIAAGQVVTRFNNLTDSVNLAAGPNITITPSGNTLTIAGAAGSSVAYQAISNTAQSVNPPGRVIISKEVPAGTYLIFFKTAFFNIDGDAQNVSCRLSTGDVETIRLGANGDAHTGMVVLQDAATFATTTTISVHCSGFNVSISAGVGSRIVLTALKVDSIQ